MAFRSKNDVVVNESPIIKFQSPSLSSAATSALSIYLSSTTSFSSAAANGHAYSSMKRRAAASRKSETNLVHGWLEAMRDSSPPLIRGLPNSRFQNPDVERIDMHYRAWMGSHPSALDRFDKIIEAASAKRVVMFLDYDGTLSPIVKDPECAFMSDEMRMAVKELASLTPTAIITGRSREKVYEFVQLPELFYAGSHGMDIMGPAEGCNGFKAHGTKTLDEQGNEVVLFQPASEFVVIMNEVFKLLEEKTKTIRGAKIDHNKFCVSVHFRRVKEENWLALAEHVQDVLKLYPNLRLTQGRKILEFRPDVAWNKGNALDYLLKTLGFGNRNDVFPIYIGDDQTDEDAFKVMNKRKHGIGILVSDVVKETNAVFSLRDPSEVLEFLQLLVKWKRRRLNRFTSAK